MDARSRVLARLPRPASGACPPVWVRAPLPQEDLWERFRERLEAVGGRLGDLPSDLGQTYLDGGVDFPATGSQSDVWEAETGVTVADLAIAETGSLLIAAGPGRARLASLAPPRHVVLVRRSQIVATLEEGLAALSGRTSVLITGPSRTADIAGILVRGIHGPKELIVVIQD